MKLSLNRTVLTLGYAAMLLLPNHDLFNYIFRSTPLVVWKQVLALLLLLSAAGWLLYAKRSRTRVVSIGKMLSALVLLCGTLTLYSLLLGISGVRIAYGVVGYIGFAGFAVFACIVKEKDGTENLFNTLFFLSLVGALGIIADYFTPILDFLPRSEGNEYETQLSMGYLRRAAFLFGASTTIFPLLSMGLVAAATLYISNRTRTRLFMLITLLFLTLAALYLTGSRANLLLYSSFSAVVYLVAIRQSAPGKRVVLLALPFLVSPLLLSTVAYYAEQFDALRGRYLDPFSSQALGNDHRYYVWGRALDMFNRLGIESVLGHGLGTTVSTIDDGFEYSTHFESSFFQAFYEGGAIGLLLRYLPVIVVFYSILSRASARKEIQNKLLIAWLIWYVIAIAIAPTAGAYHTQMAYFLACGLALYGRSRASRPLSPTVRPTPSVV